MRHATPTNSPSGRLALRVVQALTATLGLGLLFLLLPTIIAALLLLAYLVLSVISGGSGIGQGY